MPPNTQTFICWERLVRRCRASTAEATECADGEKGATVKEAAAKKRRVENEDADKVVLGGTSKAATTVEEDIGEMFPSFPSVPVEGVSFYRKEKEEAGQL